MDPVDRADVVRKNQERIAAILRDYPPVPSLEELLGPEPEPGSEDELEEFLAERRRIARGE